MQGTKLTTDPPHLCCKITHSLIHSDYFYSASSSSQLPRGTPNTARTLCRSLTPECHRQLRLKDLPKVSKWLLEWNSNPRPFGRMAPTLSMSHHAPQLFFDYY